MAFQSHLEWNQKEATQIFRRGIFQVRTWPAQKPWDWDGCWHGCNLYVRGGWQRYVGEVSTDQFTVRLAEPWEGLWIFFLSMMRSPPQGNIVFMLCTEEKHFYHVKLKYNNDLLWIIFIIYPFELSNVQISHSFQTFKFCLNFCLFLKMKRGDYNKLNLLLYKKRYFYPCVNFFQWQKLL